MKKFETSPRTVYFKSGKAVGTGIDGRITPHDTVKSIPLPVSEIPLFGEFSVVGKTEKQIREQVFSLSCLF